MLSEAHNVLHRTSDWLMNNELGRTLKDEAVVYFKALSQQRLRKTTEPLIHDSRYRGRDLK
jgi:hypothetical protein